MSLGNYMPAAKLCTEIITRGLVQRGLEPLFQTIGISERNGFVWLIMFLDVPKLSGKLETYAAPDTLHHLKTLLRGKPIFLSNSTGLRYIVLLSNPPRLPDTVSYPDDLERDVFMLGESYFGPILLSGMRNCIITGEPGSGKSTFLELLALTAHQHQWLLFGCDPERATFSEAWESITAAPIAESPTELIELIELVHAEMARRKALFQESAGVSLGPADLKEYNRRAIQPLKRVIVVIDEANSYFDNKMIVAGLEDISRRGRKWGVILVLAAHSWRAADVSRSLSAMFPYRVSFRVADDTSGSVVLGSKNWGKTAMNLQQPGRGVIRLDGRYQIFQACRLTLEQKLAHLHPFIEPEPFDKIELALVQYALHNLDGRFIVNRLAEAMQGQGITHHQVQKTAEQFERRGWLTKPAHATDPRRITPELARLVGAPRTGVQAVQVRTGAAIPIQDPVQVGCA